MQVSVVTRSWSDVKDSVMAIERSLYHPPLQQSEEEVRATYEGDGLFLLLYEGVELAGFICGEDANRYVWEDDEEYIPALNAVYVETFNIHPLFQGKGYGHRLLRLFVEEAGRRGYTYVAGHWGAGASVHVASKAGAALLSKDEDFGGSGKTYYYGLINVKRAGSSTWMNSSPLSPTCFIVRPEHSTNR